MTEEMQFLYKGETIPLTMDLTNHNDPRTSMILMVRPGTRVLEFGCNAGFCSKVLVDMGCTVVGVEIDEAAAEQARKYCERVIVADVEHPSFDEYIGGEQFDHVLMGGFVEHLRYPQEFLLRARAYLSENGTVIVYVPNIANWTIRTQLLAGEFQYEPTGILDNTHLYHFTEASFRDLMRDSGYTVERMRKIILPIDENAVSDALEEMLIPAKPVIEHLHASDAETFILVAEGSVAK